MRIILCRGTSLISRLIEWQSRGQYSHAALLFPESRVIESREFIGVREVPVWQALGGTHYDVFEVETCLAQDGKIREFARKQVGKRYDYVGVARFVTRRGYSAEMKGKWFCSELVVAAFAMAGIKLFARTSPWEVSPAMLARSPLLHKS